MRNKTRLGDSTLPAILPTTIFLLVLLVRERRMFWVLSVVGIVTRISSIFWHYLPVFCSHKSCKILGKIWQSSSVSTILQSFLNSITGKNSAACPYYGKATEFFPDNRDGNPTNSIRRIPITTVGLPSSSDASSYRAVIDCTLRRNRLRSPMVLWSIGDY